MVCLGIFMERHLSEDLDGAVGAEGCMSGTETLYVSLAVVVTCHKAQSPVPTGATTPGTAEVLTQSELPHEDAAPGH